jgi:hypothetical protein
MNGNNGTPNDNGKVVISYGADYTTLGATGGSKDAVVVAHTHTLGGGVRTLSGAVDFGGGAGNMGSINATDTSGVSGVDKNMQPYVVRLRIMKL